MSVAKPQTGNLKHYEILLHVCNLITQVSSVNSVTMSCHSVRSRESLSHSDMELVSEQAWS